jgi:hypothetical protein
MATHFLYSDASSSPLLGGAVAASPLAAHAQQAERTRRIGVLMHLAADDPEAQARIGAFLQGLQEWGWAVGRNVRIEYRWAAGDAERIRKYAAELVALAPDVILATGGAVVGPLLEATSTVPIVFAQTPDPVGAGFVTTLARPGSNATGFTIFEYGISGKWVELLKEIAPRVTRVAVLRDPAISAGTGQLGAIQSVAPSFGVELSPVNMRDASEIERAVTAFAQSLNGGLIVTGSALAAVHRPVARGLHRCFRGEDKNSCAEAKAYTENPIDLSNRAVAVRTEASSSMIEMTETSATQPDLSRASRVKGGSRWRRLALKGGRDFNGELYLGFEKASVLDGCNSALQCSPGVLPIGTTSLGSLTEG